MSRFGDNFNVCMTSKGLPAPGDLFEDAGKVLEFLHQLHSAAEDAGIDVSVMTVAEALEALQVAGVGGVLAAGGEEGLEALGIAAGATVEFYEIACLGCLAATGLDELRKALASNPPEPWLRDRLAQQGIDAGQDSAVA